MSLSSIVHERLQSDLIHIERILSNLDSKESASPYSSLDSLVIPIIPQSDHVSLDLKEIKDLLHTLQSNHSSVMDLQTVYSLSLLISSLNAIVLRDLVYFARDIPLQKEYFSEYSSSSYSLTFYTLMTLPGRTIRSIRHISFSSN